MAGGVDLFMCDSVSSLPIIMPASFWPSVSGAVDRADDLAEAGEW